MKQKNTYCGILTSELTSLFTQPWFWIAILLVGAVQFFNLIYGESGSGFMYESMGMDAFRQYSIIYLSVMFADLSYFSWARYCICAFPVVAIFARDIKQKRLTFILPRSGYFSYAVAKVVTTLVGAFLCMFLGDMLFYVVAHWGLDMPFTRENYVLSDGIVNHLSLSQNGLQVVFLFAIELNHGLEAAYYALLTLVISYWIQENHFLSVMPLLLRFIISYYMPYFDSNWDLLWTRYIHPVPIYRYLGWGLFQEDALPQLGYAFVYTMVLAILVILFLYLMLKRRGKRKKQMSVIKLACIQKIVCFFKGRYIHCIHVRQSVIKEQTRTEIKKSWIPDSIRQMVAVWSFNMQTSIFSPKWLVLSIVSFSLVSSAMFEYVKYALDYQLLMPPVGFAAILTSPLEIFFLIYISSAFPLRNPLQRAVWLRSGCKIWTYAQTLTMISLLVVWVVEMHLFILINMIGCIEWTNDWGSVWAASATKMENLGYLRKFAFEMEIINYYKPYQALGIYILLFLLTGFLFSEFIFFFDGLTNRYLGEVILVVWVLAWDIVDGFVYTGGYSKIWQYLSPKKWLDLKMYFNNPDELKNMILIMMGLGILFCAANQMIVKKKLLLLE
ncbi:MAG: hypothetical protein ACI4C1_01335 [Lachnospiraceae bacterium]